MLVLHFPAYFRIYTAILIGNETRRKLYGEDYSTSSLRGSEHAYSLLCRELVMTVSIVLPVQERKGMLLVESLLAQSVRRALVHKSH